MMISKLLLPNKYKKWGWFILIPATLIGSILLFGNFRTLELKSKTFAIFSDELFYGAQFFSIIKTNVTPTIVGVLFIVGALVVGFSKEKNEDEFIASIRMSSLIWAVVVNYILLLVSFLFFYGMAFFSVMVYNMFTTLIIFIARFNYLIYKNSKVFDNEEYN